MVVDEFFFLLRVRFSEVLKLLAGVVVDELDVKGGLVVGSFYKEDAVDGGVGGDLLVSELFGKVVFLEGAVGVHSMDAVDS